MPPILGHAYPTVTTAIVVIALLAVFKEQVTTAVKNAFDSVSGSGKS